MSIVDNKRQLNLTISDYKLKNKESIKNKFSILNKPE